MNIPWIVYGNLLTGIVLTITAEGGRRMSEERGRDTLNICKKCCGFCWQKQQHKSCMCVVSRCAFRGGFRKSVEQDRGKKRDAYAVLFCTHWWLVRVTLVVDWRFLHQNVGPMVGTYKGLLLLCECRWGGDCTCRWWGHLTSICYYQTFLSQVVGALKLV